jgi:ComF family protein
VFAGAGNALIRGLFAPQCVACASVLDQPLGSPVCPACWRGVLPIPHPACRRCSDALPQTWPPESPCRRCQGRPSPIGVVRAAGCYEGALRDIIHAFKYRRHRLLADPLAELMRRAGADLLASADIVIPVPLHPWRAVARGFNQADDLALRLGPPVWRLLRRVRAGPPQATLIAEQRAANVRRAFSLRNERRGFLRLVSRAPPLFSRLSVVLIDDVMTTGETMEACGEVLREAGVERISGLTVARAVAGRPAARHSPPRPWAVPRQ